ncbi:hypothetical protein [Mycobacterium sp. RTGN3]|uniref:hypothetical protein n=1 Tax=Mycobacterium sp. RTGN3 TaxID=3016524 RepID=UPI0029C7E0E0|nr:hypothetical protein [Mycobacterium sp. RTGN3]
MSRAQQRLENWGVDFSFDAVAPTIQTALEVLQQSDVPTPPRGVEIVVELTTIAAMMRVRFEEDALTADEIGGYTEVLRGFLNSWFHE